VAITPSPNRPRAVSDRTTRIAIWLACVSPLVWIPGGFSRFVFAKALVVAAACGAGALARPTGRLPREITLVLISGAAVFTLAGLLGDTPVASLVGRWPRYEGLPMLGLYCAAAWLGARVGGPYTRAADQLVRAIAGAGWVLFVFSALDAMGVSPLGASVGGARTGSLLGNATDQGLVAMMTILVLLPVALERRDAYLLATTAAAAITLGLSGSRAAVLVTALGLVVPAVLRDRQARRLALAGLGVLITVVLVLPESRDRLLHSGTVSGRWLQWRLTMPLAGEHSLLGIGPSRYVDAFGRHETTHWARFTGLHTYADSPHDVVLQVWLAGGIPLLLIAGALAVLVVRCGWRAAKEEALAFGLLLAVSGYAVAMLANFTIACSTCLAAFLAGCLLAKPPPAPVDAKGRRRKAPTTYDEARWIRPAAVGIASLAIVALLAGCISEIALQRGMDAVGRGDVSTARHDFSTARALRPLDSDVSMLEAQALAALANRGDESAATLTDSLARRSLDRTPTTYAALLARGTAQLTLDQPADAERTFLALTRSYPVRPDGFIQLAIARYGTGDRVGAEAAVHRAIRIAPHYRLARTVLRRLNAQPPAS